MASSDGGGSGGRTTHSSRYRRQARALAGSRQQVEGTENDESARKRRARGGRHRPAPAAPLPRLRRSASLLRSPAAEQIITGQQVSLDYQRRRPPVFCPNPKPPSRLPPAALSRPVHKSTGPSSVDVPHRARVCLTSKPAISEQLERRPPTSPRRPTAAPECAAAPHPPLGRPESRPTGPTAPRPCALRGRSAAGN